MRKSAMLVLLMATFPLIACAKSDKQACEEIAVHAARLRILSDAPLNADKERIEHAVRNELHSEDTTRWVAKCTAKEYPSRNPNWYQCAMAAKTFNEGSTCESKFPIKNTRK
jgi:hypothetical protein